MRFFASASAILAMATAAVAQTADFNPVYRPSDSEEVPAGSSFEVVWQAPEKYADGTVSIHLIGGADQGTLVPIADIASGVANSDEKYTWAVDAALGSENIYGLIFRWESDPEIFQYSQPFQIKASTDGGDDGEDDGEDGGEDDKPTHTDDGGVIIITTVSGTKTITISSCPPTETETAIVTSSFAPNTTWIETSTTAWVTTTKLPNETTTYVAPTLPPTVVEPPAPTTEVEEVPAPSSTPSDIPESSAARIGSGALALAGGLAMALLL